MDKNVAHTSHEQADNAHGERHHHDDWQLKGKNTNILIRGYTKLNMTVCICVCVSHREELPVFGFMESSAHVHFIYSVVS